MLAGGQGSETPGEELPRHTDLCALTALRPLLLAPETDPEATLLPFQVIQLFITRLFHKLGTVLTMWFFYGVFGCVLLSIKLPLFAY